MKEKAILFFEEILEIHSQQNVPIAYKYPKLRNILERVCKDLTSPYAIEFSGLFTRLSFICDRKNVPEEKRKQIHSFRITANKVIHNNIEPTRNQYLGHIKALSETISDLYDQPLLDELKDILPEQPVQEIPLPLKSGEKIKFLRVTFEESRNNIFLCTPDEHDEIQGEIEVDVTGIINIFTSIKDIWKGAKLNLVNVQIIDEGRYKRVCL